MTNTNLTQQNTLTQIETLKNSFFQYTRTRVLLLNEIDSLLKNKICELVELYKSTFTLEYFAYFNDLKNKNSTIKEGMQSPSEIDLFIVEFLKEENKTWTKKDLFDKISYLSDFNDDEICKTVNNIAERFPFFIDVVGFKQEKLVINKQFKDIVNSHKLFV